MMMSVVIFFVYWLDYTFTIALNDYEIDLLKYEGFRLYYIS